MSGVPQFGTTEFGSSPPAPYAPLPGCDVLNSVNDVWFRLGFQNYEDMAVDDRWVTLSELWQFADDVVKALSRSTGVFMTYDASIAVIAGQPSYALPASHVYTEGAWLLYAGMPLRLLRLSGVGQLFALDANWGTTVGDPTRLSLDAQDVETCILYPSPIGNATLAQIMEACPITVGPGSSALPLSPVLGDMFSYACLAGARSKESDSRDGEMAAHFAERVSMYRQIVEKLWGPGI